MDNQTYKKWAGRFLLFASPLFCYIIFEGITGNLLQIHGEFIVWNLLFYYTIYLLFFGITNSTRISCLTLNTLFTVWAIAEYFLVEFRDRPIMFSDLMAWQTATTVAGSYSYMPTAGMAAGVLLMLAGSFLIWKFPVRIDSGKKRLTVFLSASVWALCWTICFFAVVVPARSIDVSMWKPAETYRTQGALLCTMRMAGYLRVEKPEGYQSAKVKDLYNGLEETAAGEEITPVNIICIMNESWSDLSVIGSFETDEACFTYYESMTDCIKGSVYVPVFGAMTSNTEYEFLTGNSMAFAPSGSVPFQIYMKKKTPSIVESVKSQGYHTIAMHPYPAENWNRTEAYGSLGFDQFLDLEYFEDSPTLRGYVSDRGSYEKVIQLTQEHEEESLFIFLVTMQNHGGYAMDFEATVHLTEYEDMPQAEQYLSLIRESDMALEYLIEHYKASDEPTLIMMFGDHQPGIEEELYEALYGSELSSVSPEDYLSRYATPFFIWTNYDNNLEEQTDFSVVYLSNQVLKAANLPLNGYQTFLEALKTRVPVIHFMGYYDEEGNWQSWTGWESKDSYEWLQPFGWFQYYRMFDMK